MRIFARIAAALAVALAAPLLNAATERPSTVTAPLLQPGESWIYRELEAFGARKEVNRWTLSADELSGARAARGGPLRPAGRYEPPLLLRPYPLSVGQRWSQETRLTDEAGIARTVRLEGRVIGWERIRVPAGEFDALRIERELRLGDAGRYRTETRRIEDEWYVPALKAPARLRVWEQANDPTLPRTLQHTLVNRELFELIEHRGPR